MSGILSLPWCLKPIFGYIFDKLRKILKKSKYIVLFCAAARITIFSILSYVPVHYGAFYIFMFISSLLSLFENIICEYTLVVSSKQENKKNGNSESNHLPLFFGLKALGATVGVFMSG